MSSTQAPDARVAEYQTECGVYQSGCGLDNVHLSWGHDEYIYTRRERSLTDRSTLKWVRAFNRFDLYSKGATRPNITELLPYYQALAKEFFPEPLRW